MNYNNINYLEYKANCTEINQDEWQELMQNATIADKRKVNLLIKRFLPDFYQNLNLNFFNPYKYYKTKSCLVVVHSAIEYFIKFKF